MSHRHRKYHFAVQLPDRTGDYWLRLTPSIHGPIRSYTRDATGHVRFASRKEAEIEMQRGDRVVRVEGCPCQA